MVSGSSSRGTFWKITSYLVTNLSVTLFWVFFFVLNRTRVIGRHHVGEAPNTILLSNHQSMIDSFLVGLAAYYPKSLVKPYLIPWNPAAAENFYKTPILAWLADKWRCIPVREGRRDPKTLKDMIRALPEGVMVLFPEGSRTRDGSVGAGRAGAGALILATQPRVIPVAIHGMRDVLPIGKVIPRIGKRVIVFYGSPVEYREYLNGDTSRDAAQAVVDRVMERIRSQHAELTGYSTTNSSTVPQLENMVMNKQDDYQRRRKREEDLKKHPDKAPGHEKLPEPKKIPRPPEATPPEIRKPTRPDSRN